MSAPKRRQCQALDVNADRCRRFTRGDRHYEYHGAGDLYGYLANSVYPQWVVVYLCDQHREPDKASR